MENDSRQLLVSVIVPSYKRNTDLVFRAIRSLEKQTYKNVEIILVDDNAKKEHEEFRNALSKKVDELKIPNLIYLKNEKNLGGSLSRNRGIDAAKGDFITFLDDDDMYEPQKIEHQLRFIVEKKLDLCISDLSIYDEGDNLIDYRDHRDIESFDNNYLFRYHLTKQIAGTPTFMFKTESLKKIGGFDDAVTAQEYYLISKAINNGLKIGYFPESNIRAYRYDIEAISTGPGKILGEKRLFKYKKQYFKDLKFKERNYIVCRHYAVMSVAYKRNKKYFKSFLNLLLAFAVNPFLSFKEAFNLGQRKRRNK